MMHWGWVWFALNVAWFWADLLPVRVGGTGSFLWGILCGCVLAASIDESLKHWASRRVNRTSPKTRPIPPT